LLNIKTNRPKLVCMCRYELATYWSNFMEICLTRVKILQKVLGGLLFFDSHCIFLLTVLRSLIIARWLFLFGHVVTGADDVCASRLEPWRKIMYVLSILLNLRPFCNFLHRNTWLLCADANVNTIAMSSLMYKLNVQAECTKCLSAVSSEPAEGLSFTKSPIRSRGAGWE